MQKITLAIEAMATRFEFVLLGEDPVRLRAAGEEALDEIERIESQLSLYKVSSEIAQVNARAAAGPVRVTPITFGLLQRARTFWEITGGLFDVTIAPLVRCWGFMKSSGSRPEGEQIAKARELVGMDKLSLDPDEMTVEFARPGMMLDLGSIGKGYALDMAAEILQDAGVENALLHGGTSTIYGLGRDVTGPWKVSLDKPGAADGSAGPGGDPADRTLAVLELKNQAMSISAVWGKFFVLDGKSYGHVIDPRTGWPARDVLLGCVVVDAATDSDALSTGVLLGSDSDLKRIVESVKDFRYLRASMHGLEVTLVAEGIELKTPIAS